MSVALLILGLSLMTLLHELGHAAMARVLGMHVTVISVGFGPPLWYARWRGVEVLVCLIPFGGFVRVDELTGDDPALETRPVSLRDKLAVTVAGSFANYLLAMIIAIVLAAGWGKDTGRIAGLEVTMVSEHAARAGLSPGDLIVRADGEALESVEQLQAVFGRASARAVRLEIVRSGEAMELSAVAAGPTRAGLGARYVPKPELVRVGIVSAVGQGAIDPLHRAAGLLRASARWLTPARASRPLSPVGLAARVAQSGRWDVRRVLSFAALLSVVVGLFNLLPIPGLDGGRVCIALGEAATGRRLKPRVAIGIQITGAMILFALWIAIAVFDLLAMGG